jgi:hypothetical protein
MSRKKIPLGEKIAIWVSIIALFLSVWSVFESRRALAQSRWVEFRGSALVMLAEHRRSFSHALCVLRVSDQTETKVFENAVRNLDELEASLDKLRYRPDSDLEEFETLLVGSNASFRELMDEIRRFKSVISAEELERVGTICDLPA